MELSIIVTSYKNPALLKVCLNSIKENIGDISHEIIVADSQTQEDTEMMMREEYHDVVFFPFQENVGFQALLKKGIEQSSGGYLLLLNGDIIIKNGSIEQLLAFIKSNPDVGMVGPKLLNFNGTMQDSCFRFYEPKTIVFRRTFLGKMPFAKRHLDWFLMKDYDHEQPREVDWIMGSAMLVSRKALQKVGLMDPRFFMYMEDVDWCRRFWENGFKVIYYPLASAHHYHGKGSKKGSALRSLLFSRLTWIHIFSALKYFKKYWGKSVPEHN
ncbi:MAG TPA: glycosyltransferase family 2 protein [Patescibacteria group bacterium]